MTKLWLRLALLGALAGGGVAVVPEVAVAQTRTSEVDAPRGKAPSRAEVRNYAEREQKASPELKKFEGGAVVLVISTLGAIVIGIVLLVLLL